MDKKAQVTIFIIVAILIIAGILGVIFFTGEKELKSPKEVSPAQFVKSCISDSVEDALKKVLDGGGKIEPQKSISYNGIEHNFLCYQADYYLPCYNIQPGLQKIAEEEIKVATESAAQTCFDLMKQEYEDQGFDVKENGWEYGITLLPGSVNVKVRKSVEVTKGGASQSFSDFDFKVLSATYDLIRISREIVNAEAEYCYFDYSGYMLLYPMYHIKEINYEESKIYSVRDRSTNEDFKFAVRSCVPKPGL